MNIAVNDKIKEAAKKLIIDCMGTKQDEKLLIVTDEKKVDIGCAFAIAGRELGIDTTMVEATSQAKGEPSAPVAAAMAAADVEFLLTSMSYSHVKARIAATESGVRIASMPLMTTEIAENYLDADYIKIKKASEKLADMMKGTKTVRVVTEAGTDVTMAIEGRQPFADSGDLTTPGAFGNLPAGEACIAPHEDAGEGKIVVDGCVAYLGSVKDNIILTLKDGRISSIEGGESAADLRKFLEDKDDEAVGIAEFGIGTNPGAKIIGHPLVDEKVWGTIHIAFGMNKSLGGQRDSNIHYDCIINNPTVYFDGVKIMDCGKHVY